ncbi:MAG: hypothetical protein LUQ11_07965 [Methylococcaceae bacterium]|nr:hypothetical protein [Methylococcaceae bacterium]
MCDDYNFPEFAPAFANHVIIRAMNVQIRKLGGVAGIDTKHGFIEGSGRIVCSPVLVMLEANESVGAGHAREFKYRGHGPLLQTTPQTSY